MADAAPRPILAVSPSQLAQGTPLPLESTLAVMAYRLGNGGRLLQAALPQVPPRGLLMVDDLGWREQRSDCIPLTEQLLQVCRQQHYTGVIANWCSRPSPVRNQLTQTLEGMLTQAGLSLWVPEAWGTLVPHAYVLLSSALSGGTLEGHIRRGMERFGRERLVLAVEGGAVAFSFPGGDGIPLSAPQLHQRLRRGAATYFSPALCCRYCTEQAADGAPRLILYDDGASLRQKLELAAKLGCTACLMAAAEAALLPPQAGSPPPQGWV